MTNGKLAAYVREGFLKKDDVDWLHNELSAISIKIPSRFNLEHAEESMKGFKDDKPQTQAAAPTASTPQAQAAAAEPTPPPQQQKPLFYSSSSDSSRSPTPPAPAPAAAPPPPPPVQNAATTIKKQDDEIDENPRKFKPTGKQHNQPGIVKRIGESTLSHHRSNVDKALGKLGHVKDPKKIDFSDVFLSISSKVNKAMSKLDGRPL